MVQALVGDYTEVERDVPVIIDLGEIKELGAVKPSFKERKKGREFIFEVSVDGKVYKIVKPTQLDEFNWQEYEPIEGRYLKLTFIGDDPVYLNEIRVRKP